MKKYRVASLPAVRAFRIAALLGLAAATLPSHARAATYTWTGMNGNTMGTAGNWSPATTPASSTETALVFGSSPQLTPQQNITPLFQLNAFTFTSAAGAYVLGGQGAYDLRATVGGTLPTITQNSASAVTINDNLTLDNNLTVAGTGTGTLTLGGVISGAGGLTFSHAGGTLVLSGSGANSFTGLTSVTAGTLQLNKSNSTLALGGDLSIGNAVNPGAAGSAVVQIANSFVVGTSATSTPTNVSVYADGVFNTGATSTSIGALAMTGGTVNIGAGMYFNGDVTVNGSATGSVITGPYNNSLQLTYTTRTFTVADGAAIYDLDLQTGIANGTLVKAGAGTLRLTNNNGAAITLNAGTLALGSDTALNGGFTLAGGTVTADGGNRTISNPVSLTGNATFGASLDGTPRSLTFTGSTTLGASATLTNANPAGVTLGAISLGANSLTLAGANAITVNGAVTGTGGVAVNAPGATVTFGGGAANTYTGLTSVTAGTLYLDKNNGTAALGGNLSIGNATNPGAADSVVVRVTNDGQITSSTNVTVYADGQLNVGPVDYAIGSLTMTGGEVRTYVTSLNGDVTINPSAAGSLISSPDLIIDLELIGPHNFNVADGAALYDLDVQSGLYDGALTKTGAGTMRLAGANSLSVTLAAGTLALANNNAVESGLTLAGGTVVADGASRTVSSALNVTGNATVGSSVDGTPRSLTFGGATNLGAGTTLTVSNNATTTFTGVVSGAGGLLKTGVGTLTLGNAANIFTGGLTLNGGTLNAAGDGNLGATSNVITLNAGRLVFTGNVTTARTFNLGDAASLGSGTGTTLTFGSGASVNGGNLASSGSFAFADGSALNGATALIGSTLTQNAGTTAWDNVTLRGALTQTGGTLNATDGLTVTTSGTLAVGGTANLVNGGEIDGVATINNGGTLATGTGNLYLGGGSRTTINSGGTLTAGSGTSIELNGALLVNNGVQNGNLNVNYGSQARGTGFFGTVTVGQGGQFGNNTVAGGGANALTPGTTPAAANFWQTLDRARQASANALPYLGPQPATTPQQTSVQNLILGAGSTFNFNLQNTQGPAGVGYDLTNVGNQLTLTGGVTAGNQITIRLISLDQNGNNAAVASFDGTQPYQFTLVQTANGVVGYAAGEFAVSTASFVNDTQGGTFSVVQQGNNLVLVFTPVPEPGTWALVFIGASGLLLVVRRRRGC